MKLIERKQYGEISEYLGVKVKVNKREKTERERKRERALIPKLPISMTCLDAYFKLLKSCT